MGASMAELGISHSSSEFAADVTPEPAKRESREEGLWIDDAGAWGGGYP